MKERDDRSAVGYSELVNKRKRRWPWVALRIIVSAGLIYWLIHGISLREVFFAIRMVDLRLIALALLLNFVGYTISINRWRILLKAQGVKARFLFLVQSYMTGIFFNNLLPSTIGGDAVRAYDSWRISGKKGQALSVIFVDRFTGTLALMVFATAAIFFFQTTHLEMPLLQWLLVSAVVIGSTVLWLVFSNPPSGSNGAQKEKRFKLPKLLRPWFDKVRNAFSVFQGKHRALFWALGLSLLLQTNVIAHYYVIAVAMGFSIDIFNFFYIIPLSLAVMAIPISINAIGLREGAFTFFLGMHGVSTADAVAFAWVVYLVLVANGLIGGAIYAFRR